MKIAIAQLNPTIGDLAGNAQQVLEAARQADQLGANLLVTTELVLCGYPPRDLLLRPSFIDEMGLTVEQLAQNLPVDLPVLVGLALPNSQARDHGGKALFNSTVLLHQGKIQQVFHKQLLPTYDVFDEARYFAEGQGFCQFDLWERSDAATRSGTPVRIGVTICEDLWNDEEFWGGRSYPRNPIANLAETGVDLIVNLSASPYSVNKQKLRESMLGHSSTRFHCPIVYANQVGANDDLIFDGSSVAFNRQGEVVARAASFERNLVLVEYDAHQRDLQSGQKVPLFTSEDAEIWSALVLGVRDYAHKCGFSKAVIGLSGGIDSALVAAIATAALGPDNVFGVLMPSPYSSDHSVKDALDLCQNLGIRYETLPIGTLMQGYDKTLEGLFAGTEFGIAEENIQSRIRGNLLMAVANKFGYLLLSTGNKSEMAVGYCTLYGDMNGGLAVIADVPKTRVYSLCNWLNERTGEQGSLLPSASSPIPSNILAKPPSAELKPGQVDQDSLPPYEVLDDILERLVQRQQSLVEIVEAGHDPETVKKVVRLVSRAEFKRRQAPPVLKITDRAFGMGWRMPIASRWSMQLPVPKAPLDVKA
ncbi:NAD+ synthase [Pseudanabaena sp. FACHB-2040]|uniref:NAD+ synthase n=1 Tax=Pseudanabaena sp. FACHB-2040 TaxID=2692859 RepID=UPI001685F098|nr:NAD+ synthase [Pseudanabaena sp. FACHB-2040]MBD2258652.1 NAD+ synthase [Pseudanabaena sp. FACHB-2040]